MKKQLLIVAGVVGIAVVAVFAQTAAVNIWSDYLGLHIGAKSTDKIGFYGATPVAKQTGVTNAGSVLVTLTQAVKPAETQVALSQAVKAAATEATLTLNTATISYVASVDGGTGIMAEVSVVTNASIVSVFGFADTTPQVVLTSTVNSVFGFASTTPQVLATSTVNAVAGLPSTNTINGIVNALRNLGLAGN